MKKDEIISRLSQMGEVELNEMLSVYRNHRPKKATGKQVITIPDYLLRSFNSFNRDEVLHNIVKSLPACLTEVEAPSKTLLEKCKQIYIENCFCFDDVGELFVQKVLEYASSYQTKPLILYGAPGTGKSHRAQVLSLMMGLPYYRVNIPLVAHGSGIAGESPAYKNAGCGFVVKSICETQSCNLVFNGDELDKEENMEGRPSCSDQILKIIDQDATRFRDNRLGFDIDVSHIVYVFTANDKNKISAPMLDRCDVIEISPPSKLEMENIVRGSVIPKALSSYRETSDITFCEEAIEYILKMLWNGSETSLRQYQNLISKCVNAANYARINEERSVIIGVSDVEQQLHKMSSHATSKRKIGFC